MTDRNKKLASDFHALASIYRFLGDENPFRALAYKKGSRAIQDLPEDISVYNKQDTLTEIPGIGESLRKDIQDFLKTGSVKRLDHVANVIGLLKETQSGGLPYEIWLI